jgi:hypothetical protein
VCAGKLRARSLTRLKCAELGTTPSKTVEDPNCTQRDLLRVDINSFGRLDLTVFIALINPVYRSARLV